MPVHQHSVSHLCVPLHAFACFEHYFHEFCISCEQVLHAQIHESGIEGFLSVIVIFGKGVGPFDRLDVIASESLLYFCQGDVQQQGGDDNLLHVFVGWSHDYACTRAIHILYIDALRECFCMQIYNDLLFPANPFCPPAHSCIGTMYK